MAEEPRDPVEESADPGVDLYDVATWEERTSFDGLAVGVYKLLVSGTRLIVVLTALLILVGIGALGVLADPRLRILTALSVLPALALAGYIWYSDVAESEPLSTLVATFLLGVLMANFAAVINGLMQPLFGTLGAIGLVLFFYLIVGPIEETVKLLAVRFHAYRTGTFDSVLDGAVYGAVAGLGFAAIENGIYIARQVDGESGETAEMLAELAAVAPMASIAPLAPMEVTTQVGLDLLGLGGGIAVVRALAGPGHVIYSAFAGYYLGLAKFNPEHRGPIVVKGLLIATLIHGTYNSFVGIGTALIGLALGISGLVPYVIFVILFDGLFGYLLYRKIKRYRDAYHAAHDEEEVVSEGLVVGRSREREPKDRRRDRERERQN
ncbi:MAG: PrsW family intramembrane metalloprotease [Haloferacaceae archaeon]